MTLEILTSEALGDVRHGYFTRRGGASSGVFEGLNCGFGSSDQAEVVAINRARVADAMQVPTDHLVTVHQVHSADVIEVSAPLTGDAPRADAMVSRTPGVALGILTADCQPVLLADSNAGVIAAAHAGWKGARDGVLQTVVDAMVGLGATRESITATIGPSISQRAYEVGPELLDAFLDEDDGNARFFAQGKEDRYQFDLPAYGLAKLRAAGVGHAEWSRHCTYSDAERFYSYRRATHALEADYGRLISVIRL